MSRVVPRGQTDMTELIVVFLSNLRKNLKSVDATLGKGNYTKYFTSDMKRDRNES